MLLLLLSWLESSTWAWVCCTQVGTQQACAEHHGSACGSRSCAGTWCVDTAWQCTVGPHAVPGPGAASAGMDRADNEGMRPMRRHACMPSVTSW